MDDSRPLKRCLQQCNLVVLVTLDQVGEDGVYIEEQNGEVCLECLGTDIGDKRDMEGWKMQKETCLGTLRFLSLWSPFI